MPVVTNSHLYTAKDGSNVLLRPVQLGDASEIIKAAETIVEAGKFIQKEAVRTIQEKEIFINQMLQNKNM